MIAQVVFDLPLEGPFDYLIPSSLKSSIAPGLRVNVLLGTKKRTGLVTGLLEQSSFENLKSIKSVIDEKPLLDQAQMDLGSDLSRYYGCSLGEALFTILRGSSVIESSVIARSEATKQSNKIATLPAVARNDNNDKLTLHVVPSGDYVPILVSVMKPLVQRKQRVLILGPDQFAVQAIQEALKKYFSKNDYFIGARSMVFRSLMGIALVMMVDEDNPSYKQEQTPLYETRQVLLMRAKRENIDVVFISATPSVEIMDLVHKGKIHLKNYPARGLVKPQAVDLNNYKILLKGLLSPAVLSALERNVSGGTKSILVFNHRGSYAVTRCSECGFVLKCGRCDSPMLYWRAKKQYFCRHCSFHCEPDIVCPHCQVPSWKSFGLGIEPLQKALQEKFPTSRILTFERRSPQILKDYDILVGTSALLRFKYQIQAALVVLLDIDEELNRLDIRSCFRAFSLAGHLRGMAQGQFLIQTRHPNHYVIKSFSEDDADIFYREDMRIRRELALCPFGHQVMIHLRSLQQKLGQQAAQELYQALNSLSSPNVSMKIHAPVAEAVAKKRDQYRLNILVQGEDVIDMIAFIKKAMRQTKRRSKVIVVLNVDP
ncbi:MAG: primosomal protein N' [Candidatus Omnitrophica bacterium]|nr:primosomal protein N' [Candidatus Omnitrophota bacterium]